MEEEHRYWVDAETLAAFQDFGRGVVLPTMNNLAIRFLDFKDLTPYRSRLKYYSWLATCRALQIPPPCAAIHRSVEELRLGLAVPSSSSHT